MNAACNIEGHLELGDLKEAWRCLKGLYTAALDRPPKPCHNSMEKQTAEREELYWKVSPPWDPIPINVEPFDLDDSIPEVAEIRVVAEGLRNGRYGGSSGVRSEHIKMWLRDVINEEENGTEDGRDIW